MSNENLTPVMINQQITTTTLTTVEITGQNLLEMLRERLTDSFPADSLINAQILTSGTFCGNDYDFQKEPIITISYTKTTKT